MRTTAAVLVEPGQPLELADLELPALNPGQVMVEIRYSGVCHTQLLEWQGLRGEDPFLPHCLGHEGSGVVIEVGADVKKCRAGDAVILSWMKGTGEDVKGSQYLWNGRKVNAGGITTFMRHAVVSENRITPLNVELAPGEAAFLGCAVATGLGVIRNTLEVHTDNSLLVVGCGGIGLYAIAGARLAGANPIIAADLNGDRLKAAREMGATDLINPKETNLFDEIARLCPGGVSYAIEATGQVDVMRDVLAAVKPQGGSAAIIGNAAFGQTVTLNPQEFNRGKRLLGTWGGDNDPDRDFPRYQKELAEGRISAEALNPTVYSLEQINQALVDFQQQIVTRPLIDMQQPGS